MIDIKNIPDLNDVDLAFGGADQHLPKWEEIPNEFRDHAKTKWNQLFSDWFFCGLKEANLNPREGVDKKKAMRLLNALMASFGSKHEHKEAGVAYLMSQFFKEDSTWIKNTKEN